MAEEQKPENNAATPPPQAPAPAAASTPTQAESLDDPNSPPSPDSPDAPKSGVGEPIQKPEGSTIKSTFNIYFILFIVVFMAAVGTIYYAVTTANKTAKNPTKKTQSLTSDQISQLKGSTTVVGDTKTTLDVQSNAVFDGQVLVRNDLSTAGDLKVGGNLSLKDISVNGAANFNTLTATGSTTLSGNAQVQGDLSVQKGLSVSGAGSFASINVGQLTASSISLNGDFNIPRHITSSGNELTRTAGTALGGGGTVSITGNDTAGTINIHVGNAPPSGLFASVKFARPFAATPHVIVTPIGSAASAVKYYVNRDSTGFSIGCSSAPPAGSTFAFDYFVID